MLKSIAFRIASRDRRVIVRRSEIDGLRAELALAEAHRDALSAEIDSLVRGGGITIGVDAWAEHAKRRAFYTALGE